MVGRRRRRARRQPDAGRRGPGAGRRGGGRRRQPALLPRVRPRPDRRAGRRRPRAARLAGRRPGPRPPRPRRPAVRADRGGVGRLRPRQPRSPSTPPAATRRRTRSWPGSPSPAGTTAGSPSRRPRPCRCRSCSAPDAGHACEPADPATFDRVAAVLDRRGAVAAGLGIVPGLTGSARTRLDAGPVPFHRPSGSSCVRPATRPPPPRPGAGRDHGGGAPGGRPADHGPGRRGRRPRRRGDLRDLAWAPGGRRRGRAGRGRHRRRPRVIRHSAAHVLAQAVQQLFPEAKLGIGPPVETASTTTSTSSGRSPRRTWPRSRRPCRRSSRPASASPAAWSPTTRRAGSSPHEPYKLELIGLKGGAGADEPMERDVEVGGARADHLRQPARRTPARWSGATCAAARTCPPPGTSRRSSSPAPRPPTGGAARRTRSCSGSTAPRGRAEQLEAHLERLAEAERRDHRRLGAELDLFSFPDEIGSGLAVFHPKGGDRPPGDGGLLRAAAHEEGYEFVNTPHITKARAVRDLRPPGVVRRRHVPAHGRWTTRRSRKPGRTTTSSR